MDKVPIELEPGLLGCPDCRCPLRPGLVPFYHKGDKLGAFDGIICSMCGYGLLTEKGYDESGKAIEAHGAPQLAKGFVDVIETCVTGTSHMSSSTPAWQGGDAPSSTMDATLQIPVVTTSLSRRPAPMGFARNYASR